jgi:ryanodine receptor 2
MPKSGPGRQSFRRGSKKRKIIKRNKENDRDSSPVASPVPEKAHELPHVTAAQQRRFSMAPTEATGDSIPCIDDDAHGMIQLADQIDEYYYGVRIFPGQDPTSVWVGWVSSIF